MELVFNKFNVEIYKKINRHASKLSFFIFKNNHLNVNIYSIQSL